MRRAGNPRAEPEPEGYADRLISILAAFAEGPSVWSIKDLAQHIDVPASSLHRSLDQLVRRGIVERAPRRRYRMGTEFYRIAARVADRFEIVAAARPHLSAVVAASGETCVLALVASSRQRILLADKVDTPTPLRFKLDLLENISPIGGAFGRAILPFLAPADLQRMLVDYDLGSVDLEALREDLGAIRRDGVVVSRDGTAAPDAIEIAAPFFDTTGQVRGSIGVIAPEFRLADRQLRSVAALVRREASALSRLLGGG